MLVNAANSHLRLQGNTGINAQVLTQGGPVYRAAHAQLKECYDSAFPSGAAALVDSGNLHQKGVQNVVIVAGPNKRDKTPVTDQDRNQLYSCYYNSLVLAHESGWSSIAFPAISTGRFAFPKEEAAQISQRAIYVFLNYHPETNLRQISIHPVGKDKDGKDPSLDNLDYYL